MANDKLAEQSMDFAVQIINLATHTTIDGHQLTFDGTGGQLFGNYIKWLLLCIITLGIYSFWLTIKMKQWVTKHTHMA